MKRSPNLSGRGVLITVFAILEAERNVKLNALNLNFLVDRPRWLIGLRHATNNHWSRFTIIHTDGTYNYVIDDPKHRSLGKMTQYKYKKDVQVQKGCLISLNRPSFFM